MHALVKGSLPEIHDLFRSHYVTDAALFGSVVTGEFTAESDVDILVTFDEKLEVLDYADNFFSLKEKLEDLLGRRVDLLSTISLKNPVLIDSINRSKELLYAA